MPLPPQAYIRQEHRPAGFRTDPVIRFIPAFPGFVLLPVLNHFLTGGAVASSAHYCKYRKPVAIIRNPYPIHTDFADTYPPNPAKIIAYRKNMHGNHRPGLKSSALA